MTLYAKNIGVDIDNLPISQPDNGEQALKLQRPWVRSVRLTLSSWIPLQLSPVPKAEIDGDMGDSHVGLQWHV